MSWVVIGWALSDGEEVWTCESYSTTWRHTSKSHFSKTREMCERWKRDVWTSVPSLQYYSEMKKRQHMISDMTHTVCTALTNTHVWSFYSDEFNWKWYSFPLSLSAAHFTAAFMCVVLIPSLQGIYDWQLSVICCCSVFHLNTSVHTVFISLPRAFANYTHK